MRLISVDLEEKQVGEISILMRGEEGQSGTSNYSVERPNSSSSPGKEKLPETGDVLMWR